MPKPRRRRVLPWQTRYQIIINRFGRIGKYEFDGTEPRKPLTGVEISELLGIPKTTVYNVLYKYRQNKGVFVKNPWANIRRRKKFKPEHINWLIDEENLKRHAALSLSGVATSFKDHWSAGQNPNEEPLSITGQWIGKLYKKHDIKKTKLQYYITHA